MQNHNVVRRNAGIAAISLAALSSAVFLSPAAGATEAGDVGTMARKVSCASLDTNELANAWHGVDGIGGWCFVDGGTYDSQFGFSVSSYCPGDHDSLIQYKLPNDPYMYSSTAGRRTCAPFDANATIYKVTRTR